MKPLIKAQDITSLGLDVGTHSIKSVRLKFVKDEIQLIGVSIEPNQLDPASILSNIKQTQKEDTVNTSVSGSATVIRYVAFPKMDAGELRQALQFEAQKHIPFSIEQVNMDGYILKEDLPPGKMLVLIAAAKKELIEQRIKLMQDAGLKVASINIDSIALLNSFSFSNKDDDYLQHKTIALLNVGASVSNLNILENGIPRLTRDIHVAGNTFTQRIMDVFNLDFKSADSLKINPDKDKEKSAQIALILEPSYSNLAGSIRTSFDYYESQSSSSVSKIYLSGGGSKLPGFKETLKNLLGLEIDYWDPLKNIKLGDNVDELSVKELSNYLPVAMGLALSQ